MTAHRATLQRIARALRLRPHLVFAPSPKQRVLVESEHSRVLVRSCNRGGKSEAAAVKVWKFALAKPGRIILVVSATHKGKIEVVGEKLNKYAPRDQLVNSDYNATRGWKNDVIQLKNGTKIIFRSAMSASTSIAGLTVDAAWIDEPIPRALYGEIVTRVATTDGPIWWTMTPIGRPLEWLKLMVEGDPSRNIPPSGDWQQIVMHLTIEDCPWRTQDSIDRQMEGYGAWEYAQRVFGAWEGVTHDRRLESFSADNIDDHIPHRHWDAGVGMDHGEGAGREVALLALFSLEAKCLHVLDEYTSTQPTDVEEDSHHVIAMLARHNLRTTDIDRAVGDINSAGKAVSGRVSVNRLFEEALNIRMRKPKKGPGSVDYGTRLLNIGLKRGHLKIHGRCKALIKSMSHWTGKDDDLKHHVDALRYIAVKWLEDLYGPETTDRLKMSRG